MAPVVKVAMAHALQSGTQSVVAIGGIAPRAPNSPQADDIAPSLATTAPDFQWHHTSQTARGALPHALTKALPNIGASHICK
jgi:hypothetical protein